MRIPILDDDIKPCPFPLPAEDQGNGEDIDGENEPAEEEQDIHSDTDDDLDEEVSTISNEESTQVTTPYSEHTTSGDLGIVDGNGSDSTTLTMYRR